MAYSAGMDDPSRCAGPDSPTLLAALVAGRRARAEEIAALEALAPVPADLHEQRGHCLLSLGDLAAGFAETEWRWRRPDFPSPRPFFARPEWDGRDHPGATLLVHGEQGIGDVVQFCRWLPLLAERGFRPLLHLLPSHRPLAALAESLRGVDRVVIRGESLPAFDLHVAIASLPHRFGVTIESLPAACPYLAPSAAALARWRERAAPLPGLRVGVVHATASTQATARERSIPAESLPDVLRPLPGVQWISLQWPGPPSGSGAAPPPAHVIDWGTDLGDMDDTAAAMRACDLVVTIDTAAAHVAGASGCPGRVLLPFSPDWRWMLGRDDSPWYPTLRLVRQARPGDWQSAIAPLHHELAAIAAGQVPRPVPLPLPARSVPRARGLEDAVEAGLRAAAVRAPTAAGPLRHLAALARERGHCHDAAELLSAANRLGPGDPDLSSDLAVACLETGQVDRALVILARIVQARPDHLLARVNLGRALLAAGRAVEARDCLARAVTMAPHDPLVRESHAAAVRAARS